jgi:hypothetical protein
MTGMSAQPIWHETVIPEGPRVNLRYIDWIWHVRGSVPLPEGQTAGEALDRIEPVFDEVGTAHVRSDAALSFTKKNPASQDPLSVFERGFCALKGPRQKADCAIIWSAAPCWPASWRRCFSSASPS